MSDNEGSAEVQRIQLGTESRNKLEIKYKLAEDPRYEEAKNDQRSLTAEAIPSLKGSLSSEQFGRELDIRVIKPLVDKYGGEGDEAYGSRLKGAFLERIGEKAKDEIGIIFVSSSIDPSLETRRLLDLLPSGQSAEAIGSLLEQILVSAELSTLGNPQQLFEMARDAKIKEFEEFLGRTQAGK